jgi:hypothetical protein
MIPERRMPLENYTGFLALRNGVPVGYGGGWIFEERCEIGVNIFETFRGGENSYIFTNILRVYKQIFGIKQFVVPPYQFGAGNEEGLQSGAFWFYYKLGFRPMDGSLIKLAASEFNKMKEHNSYHSPIKTLKKLATWPLEFKTGSSGVPIEPRQISIVITRWIAGKFKSDQHAAMRYFKNQLISLPGIKNLTKTEKTALEYLAAFITIPGILDSLSRDEKAMLTRLIKLKAGNEIEYSLYLKRQSGLLSAWRKLVAEDEAF